jgi:hypothetical protein
MSIRDTLGGSVSAIATATEAVIAVALLPLRQADQLMTSRSIEKARDEVRARDLRKEMLAALQVSRERSELGQIA